VAEHSAPKIYTRTGDVGETGLFDGTRVSKADPRVDATGEVDELASWLGVVLAKQPGAELEAMLRQIQRDLFALGALLADPGHRIAARVEKAALGPDDVRRLERWIDALEADLPPLRRFILPGGAETGALLHLSRSVCRRAERRIVSIGLDAVAAVVLTYVNRLSDLLFVMARAANAGQGVAETEW
jgi:cob(I)alamin adenosyltransferase